MTDPVQNPEAKTKTGIVIFDLDGCVADDAWRHQYIDESATGDAKYVAYHDLIDKDAALLPGASYVQNAMDCNVFIAFVTARPHSHREQTVEWITRVLRLQPGDFSLYMRPNGDERSSPDLKSEVAKQLIEFAAYSGTKVLGAFDDRQDVIDAYTALGINAFILDKDGTSAPMLQVVEAPGAALGRFESADVEDAVLIEDGPIQPQFAISGRDYDATLAEFAQAHRDFVAPTGVDERDAGDILVNMGATYKERNALYKDNAVMVGKIMAVMFPNGVKLATAADHEFFHLFQLKIVKLTRFVNSDLKHVDSIHDDAIYSAMCERLVPSHTIEIL